MGEWQIFHQILKYKPSSVPQLPRKVRQYMCFVECSPQTILVFYNL